MDLQYSWFSKILVFSFQYPFPLLPLKSFSFHCKKLANSKKNEIKKLENELKYLEELSNTSTYKEDTS
jgi:hypothetical protein